MAAAIITLTKIGVSGTKVSIKVNSGHPIPTTIMTDVIQSFRTWNSEDGYIFIWTNDQAHEMSMIVPVNSIGWVIASRPIGSSGDRFRIDAPCEVSIQLEEPASQSI